MLSLWIVFAFLTGAAVFCVLWPLSRAPAAVDRRELDVAFYKAQATEIDRDVARGVLGPGEAEMAKTEAARRLMAAAQDVERPARSSRRPVRIVAVLSLVCIPAAALGLYTLIGNPDMPDMPLQARLDVPAQSMDMPTAVAKIERHLADDPNDGKGYDLLAPIYVRIGRPDDAVRAFAKAIALLGASAERYAGLGEAEVYVGRGVVTADAKQAFDKAIALDPKSPRASFYLGLAAEQDGDKAKALAIWRKLIAESPADAPWVGPVEARIATVSGLPAPTAAGAESKLAAAVEGMSEDQRQAMIHRMVDGLAARLKTSGDDIDGWLRLVRAYRVLNEQDKAKAALVDARRTFAADAAATKRLDTLAHELGLEG